MDQVEIERAGACVAIKLAASGCARRASEPEPATGSRAASGFVRQQPSRKLEHPAGWFTTTTTQKISIEGYHHPPTASVRCRPKSSAETRPRAWKSALAFLCWARSATTAALPPSSCPVDALEVAGCTNKNQTGHPFEKLNLKRQKKAGIEQEVIKGGTRTL